MIEPSKVPESGVNTPPAISRLFLFGLLCSLILALPSCNPHKPTTYRKTLMVMDTVVAITVVADSAERAEQSMDRAFSVIKKLDGMLNFYSDTSQLSMINRNAGIAPVKVSTEMLEVIDRALQTSVKTGGAFDVTVGPEVILWDFNTRKRPEDSVIKERLNLVAYSLIEVDKGRSTVFLRKRGMLVDLGAIAKGYAADEAVKELKRQGIQSGIVAVAGDIKSFGTKPDGAPWKIGIRNPRMKGKEDEIVATIDLTDGAISTSGDYERFFMEGEKRYHHILDPKSGYPAQGCWSVTVLAKDGADADSFSTGVFVLGPEKGIKVLEQMGLEGLIVDNNGKVWTTPGMREKIELKGTYQEHNNS